MYKLLHKSVPSSFQSYCRTINNINYSSSSSSSSSSNSSSSSRSAISTVPIPTVPSESLFTEHIGRHPDDPVIWNGRRCDALVKWRHLSYLETIIPNLENILVDVEMGGCYNDPGAERLVDVPLAHYLRYLRQFRLRHQEQQQQRHRNSSSDPNDPVLYMAQNDIPSVLLPDIGPWPTICTTPTAYEREDNNDDNLTPTSIISEGKLYGTNWWMGPVGSASPLHTDPLANVLLQMVGRKDVALVNGKLHSNDMLYAGQQTIIQQNHHGPPQGNTSPINVFWTDDPYHIEAQFPQFRPATIQRATLTPGDVLYIPKLCWHATQTTTIMTTTTTATTATTTTTTTTTTTSINDDDDDDDIFSISVNAWWR
jgi:Cupin-like domain